MGAREEECGDGAPPPPSTALFPLKTRRVCSVVSGSSGEPCSGLGAPWTVV